MTLPLIGIVIAVGASLARGGRVRGDNDAELHWLPVLVVGFLLQAGLDLAAARDAIGQVGIVALLVLSEAAVLGFGIRNWFRPGMWLIALGFTLNAAVILANGGMPVSPDAITWLGGDPGRITIAGKHQLLTTASALPWLADVLPLPLVRTIVSIGDVLLVAGMVPLAHDLMTPPSLASRRQRRALRPEREPRVPAPSV